MLKILTKGSLCSMNEGLSLQMLYTHDMIIPFIYSKLKVLELKK